MERYSLCWEVEPLGWQQLGPEAPKPRVISVCPTWEFVERMQRTQLLMVVGCPEGSSCRDKIMSQHTR